MMKKTLIFVLLFSLFCSVWGRANDTQADSLALLFNRATTPQERMRHCLNLDNYYRNVQLIDSLPLTRILFDEAVRSNNEYVITDALRKLVMGINRKERVLTNDSVIYFLNLANKVLSGERLRSFITEVRLRHIRSVADWTKDENKIIEQLTLKYAESKDEPDDIYYQIEKNYALGMASALGISENSVDVYQKTLRYYEQLFDLIKRLPLEYGAEILFWVNENIYIAYINSNQSRKMVDFLEQMMDFLRRYQELPEVKADVYQDFGYVRSLYYEGLSRFPSLVGEEKAYACILKTDSTLRQRGDILSLYFTYKGYYRDLKNFEKEILYGDSILGFMKTYDSPVAEAVMSGVYKDQGECYAALNNYRMAYELIRMHAEKQEALTNGESKKLRAEMDARYDLSHLELEKERLTSRNRQIALIFILFVFVLAVGWGGSQRHHLNRLKRMQKRLIESNKEVSRQSAKAQESEKMKTAFVGSICHEIRTPLNAINGFSSLLLDETIDTGLKQEFPRVIQENTLLLTRLLDDLLQVATLTSSAEEVEVEEVDICTVCQQEMDKLKTTEGKPSIEYRLDIAEDCRSFKTNLLYLSQTIAHLLNNANKFTESGEINLRCAKNASGQTELSVTDTGVGIPADKHDYVFERFTKIDDFTQGAGLGLYICRLMVARLGGTITIDPGYTTGTRMVVTLQMGNYE